MLLVRLAYLPFWNQKGMHQVTPEEAQMTDSGWPGRESLAGIQQQCITLSYDISNQQFSAQKMVKRFCCTLLCILRQSTELQVGSTYPPSSLPNVLAKGNFCLLTASNSTARTLLLKQFETKCLSCRSFWVTTMTVDTQPS